MSTCQHVKGAQISGYGLFRCQRCEFILGVDGQWRHPNPNPRKRA